jgi:hypothetical protein
MPSTHTAEAANEINHTIGFDHTMLDATDPDYLSDDTEEVETPTATPFSPGQSVIWISAPGGRRNLRSNMFAGISLSIPAVVKSVGAKLITIEAEGRTYRVKARNLRTEAVR